MQLVFFSFIFNAPCTYRKIRCDDYCNIFWEFGVANKHAPVETKTRADDVVLRLNICLLTGEPNVRSTPERDVSLAPVRRGRRDDGDEQKRPGTESWAVLWSSPAFVPFCPARPSPWTVESCFLRQDLGLLRWFVVFIAREKYRFIAKKVRLILTYKLKRTDPSTSTVASHTPIFCHSSSTVYSIFYFLKSLIADWSVVCSTISIPSILDYKSFQKY